MIGIFVALYLTLYKMGMIGTLSCSIGSCETVNSSRWARFLGVPVAGWGVFFYLAVLVVAIAGLQPRLLDSHLISRVLVALSGIGFIFSTWLTYLELFRIHAICIWCVTSAVIVTLILILSVLDLRDVSNPAGSTAS